MVASRDGTPALLLDRRGFGERIAEPGSSRRREDIQGRGFCNSHPIIVPEGSGDDGLLLTGDVSWVGLRFAPRTMAAPVDEPVTPEAAGRWIAEQTTARDDFDRLRMRRTGTGPAHVPSQGRHTPHIQPVPRPVRCHAARAGRRGQARQLLLRDSGGSPPSSVRKHQAWPCNPGKPIRRCGLRRRMPLWRRWHHST